MEKLAAVDSLVVSQKKEWGEILSGFETKNRYAVLDGAGNDLYMAGEKKGSLILRLMLKNMRPFEIAVQNQNGETVIEGKRPFRFFFHEITITDSSGVTLGRIVRRFSWIRRIYTVEDPAGQEIFQLFGPILHPWTFNIKRGDEELGAITKKWSGFLKEGFTDADIFGVTFPASWDIRTKALFMGAVFLIDFVHFENAKS